MSGTRFDVFMKYFRFLDRSHANICNYSTLKCYRISTPVAGTELRTFSECARDMSEKFHLLFNIIFLNIKVCRCGIAFGVQSRFYYDPGSIVRSKSWLMTFMRSICCHKTLITFLMTIIICLTTFQLVPHSLVAGVVAVLYPSISDWNSLCENY